MIYSLRDYQIDLIDKVDNAFKNYRKVLLVAPCGSGKTVIASSLIQSEYFDNHKVWFIVHRKELLDQAEQTFKNLGLPEDSCKVYMIQSLKNKLSKITEKPDIIVTDEAHHSTSNTYKRLVDAFQSTRILGLTATPTRLGGSPLGDLFDTMIQGVSANDLIKRKYLADYDYYAPKVDLDFTEARIVAGDYSKADIDMLMNKPKIYGDILNNFKTLAANRKTIAYCSSIEYSKKIAEMFNDNGFKAVHFDGSTPKKERDKIIQDFRDGKIQILCNVDLVGEGFDVPDCECVLLLRPTQSLSLYIQQATRCLRPNENKKAIIIDFVGNAYRHGMPTEDRKWTLTEKIKCSNKSGEPEILVRQCTNCFKCYQGTARVCPYCEYDNGKTRKQISEEEALELEKITEIKKKEAKREQAMAHDYESLVALGKKRGYKNPQYWAKIILKSRGGR